MNHAAIYWKMNNAPGISIVGDEIRDWPESLGPKPDAATIAEWETEYNFVVGKEKRLAAIRDEASAVILAAYPLWYQTNVANGIYSAEIGDAMKAAIGAVIAESNRCEDAVEAAATVAEIEAVSPIWPEL